MLMPLTALLLVCIGSNRGRSRAWVSHPEPSCKRSRARVLHHRGAAGGVLSVRESPGRCLRRGNRNFRDHDLRRNARELGVHNRHLRGTITRIPSPFLLSFIAGQRNNYQHTLSVCCACIDVTRSV